MAGGIDYGRFGGTNRVTLSADEAGRSDGVTVHFGVVSLNDLADWVLDESEDDFAPSCPACGVDMDEDALQRVEEEHVCPECGADIKNIDDVYPEEPSGRYIDTDGVEGFIDSSGDLWVCRSKLYTHAGAFCSPCAPGACSIGPEYLGHDKADPMAFVVPPDWYREPGKAKGNIFNLDGSKYRKPKPKQPKKGA